jgi:hypothetical protein
MKSLVKRVVRNWPLRRQLGFYSFFPVFFLLGATLEFSMINWTVGQTNFYRVYKRRQLQNFRDEQLRTNLS